MTNQKVYCYDSTVNDPQSKVRGIGRYLQLLHENFKDWIFTDNRELISADSIFVNPFYNFIQPPLMIRRIAKKQIAVIHDLIPLKYPDHFPIGIRGQLNVFLNKIALRSYDTVVTDSETSRQDIIKILNIAPQKVKVIYPILSKFFEQSKNLNVKTQMSNVKATSSNISHSTSNIGNYCLYVGDATWNKNLVNLAKAIKLINIPCVFVGKVFEKIKSTHLPAGKAGITQNNKQISQTDIENGFNNPWMREFNEFIKEVNDNKLFIFKGFVNDEELINLYTQAKVNVLLSRDEGFGFSYLEAASLGAPSVLGDQPIFHEIAGDSALYAQTDNPQDIADKISEIYFHEEIRNDYSRRASIHIKKFNQNDFVNSWNNVLT